MNNLTKNSKEQILNYIKSMNIIVTDEKSLLEALNNTCVYDDNLSVEENLSLYVEGDANLFVDEAVSANDILNSIGKQV